MKLNITTFLSLILILFFFQSQSQEVDTIATDTILKMDNPYKKGRTKWLNENGFNTTEYSWNDPEINLYLNQAVKNRSIGNATGYTGGGMILLGLLANMAGRFAYEVSNNDPDRQFQLFKAPYHIGGVLVASSVVFHINALSKIKKAKQTKAKKFSK